MSKSRGRHYLIARQYLARLAPWLIAAAILGVIIARLPVDELVAALARVSVWQFGTLAVLFVACMLAIDSLSIWLALRAVLGQAGVSFMTVVCVRGASYLLAMVSYAAGQGSIVYLLRKHASVAVISGAGAVLLATGAFLIAIALVVGTGLLGGTLPDHRELTMAAAGLLVAASLYLVLIALRPRRLAGSRWLAPFFTAGITGTLRITAARLAHLAVLITGHFTAMRLFGIEVPIGVALVGLPVLFLVAALPISPAGLGTTQAAAITLFASFASGATESARQAVILAYSLAFQVAGTLTAALAGLICLRTLSKSSKLD